MSANTYCKMLIILICLQLTPLNAHEFDEIIFRKSLAPAVQFENYGMEFKLRDRMKYYGASGVSIAVVKNKNLVFAKGYGTLAESSPNIVNEQTLFQAASLSKAVTALGIMHLVTTKQLSLDEPINNYLTSWEFEDRHMRESLCVNTCACVSALQCMCVYYIYG